LATYEVPFHTVHPFALVSEFVLANTALHHMNMSMDMDISTSTTHEADVRENITKQT
jgi:hypothetical protein